MKFHGCLQWKWRNRAVAGAWISAALLTTMLQAQGTGSQSPQTSLLLNQGLLISPGDLPPYLATSLQQTGARMMGADKAQLVLSGTISDGRGSRPAQITIQAPGYMAYREGQSRAVAFDGSSIQSKTGAPTSDDDAVMESLLAHFPDAVCLQAAGGGGFRRIGSHFRTDSSQGPGYRGPYWTLIAFSPKRRPGLTAGKALQQELFILIDESTGFIGEIRVVVNSAAKQQRVTQTQFANWSQQGEQWFPGKITRLEDGKQTLSFQVQQAGFGVAGSAAMFKP